MENMKVTVIRTDKDKTQHLTVKTVEALLQRIQTDTKAGDVKRLRQFIAENGAADGYPMADRIADIYPSVEIQKTENGSLAVTACNGVVWLHVADLLRPDDIDMVKEACRILPTTLAAFTGSDGHSVELLVSVAQKDGTQPQTETEADHFCRVAYDVAFRAYSGLLPKAIERMVGGALSHFSMTLDPTPYYNPQPTPLLVDGISHLTAANAHPDEDDRQTEMDMSLYALYEQTYQRAAEEAYDATADIIEQQRPEAYLTELVRRMGKGGVPQEETYLHLSNHHRYRRDFDEATLRAIVDAVFAELKPVRLAAEKSVSVETARMIRHLKSRYVFRYNTVMGYTEYRPNHTWVEQWQPCDDQVINSMTIAARLAGLDVWDKDVRRYVQSSMIPQCDPIDDFLWRVHDKWDGQTDHIALLARCVQCDVPQWETWFRKWFLAMVAQWMLPHQQYGNSLVPLLISPQGDGKTSFCRMLLPPELSWGFLENLDVSEKRQTLQAMHNFLLINLDEFNKISPKLQEGFLKNVIQLPNVKIKRPYGRHVEEFRRYASFIATTNEASVLTDATGSRRFICIKLTAPINTDYKPNYEGLYGQAYTLITQKTTDWWLTADEVTAVMAHNREYQVLPPAIQYFNEYFDIVDDETQGEWLSATAIYDRLRHIAGSGLKAGGVSAFGKHLTNIPGLQLRHHRTGSQYLVRMKQ